MEGQKEELVISAKPGRRISALLIDLMINLAVSMILLIPSILALINIFIEKNAANIMALFFSSLLSGSLVISFVIVYFVALPVFWEGQTVGKRFLNIKIIDITTNDGPNAKVMFLREATRIITCVLTVGISSIASLITLLISDNHITIHEQLSSTRVVNVNMYSNDIEVNNVYEENY